MKIPLDIICVRSGILCPRCRRLVESGAYTTTDVEVMKILLELEEDPNNKFLREATYIKSYSVDSMVIVLLELSNAVPQSFLIRIARMISEKMGMKVRVVRYSQDQKSMIAQLFAPARIQGIDSVWLPDGDVQYIIRVSRYDAKYLPLKINELETLLSKMFNESYRIKVT